MNQAASRVEIYFLNRHPDHLVEAPVVLYAIANLGLVAPYNDAWTLIALDGTVHSFNWREVHSVMITQVTLDSDGNEIRAAVVPAQRGH